MKEDIAIEALREVKEVFDKHGIEFWLDCGTLLGAVRDEKFISWDGDIDLGIWNIQINKLYAASQELRDRRFKVSVRDWEGRTFILTENCGIDVYLYRLIDNVATMKWLINKKMIAGQILDYLHRVTSEQRRVVVGSNMPVSVTKILYKIVNALSPHLRRRLADVIWLLYEKTGCVIHLSIPDRYFNKLSKIQFYGMEFKVPAETEEYLVYRYGENWKIPNRDYVHYKDDGAIVKESL